jgi:hypothetical protein
MLNAVKHLYRTVGRTQTKRQRCFTAFSMTEKRPTPKTKKAPARPGLSTSNAKNS